jgi:hypothetical protein
MLGSGGGEGGLASFGLGLGFLQGLSMLASGLSGFELGLVVMI